MININIKEIDWNNISKEELTIDFIRIFKEFLIWDNISYDIELDINLDIHTFREFKDYLNWRMISNRIDITEEFIREFQDYVDWHIILHIHKTRLSEEFQDEFYYKLNQKENE